MIIYRSLTPSFVQVQIHTRGIPYFKMDNDLGASSLAVLLASLSIVLGCLAVLRWWRHAGDDRLLPPGPRGLPILGYLPFLKENLHRHLTDLATVYGPIYKIWLGKKLWVVISSPSLAKEISRDRDIVFANRDATVAGSIISSGGKDIAFADHGPYWRKMRKVFVREMMSNTTLDACYSLRRGEVKKCVTSLYDKAGSPVNIGQLALSLLVDMMMAMLWGHTVKKEEGVHGLDLKFQKAVEEMMVLLAKANISDFFPALARFDLQGVERQAKRVHLQLDGFLDLIIDHAIKRKSQCDNEELQELGDGQKKKDILQIFLDLEDEMEGGENSSPSNARRLEIKAILQDIMVGGTDTTSTLTEWTMARLLNHKTVAKKVTDELTEIAGNNNAVEEHHLPKLTYLDAVIKETFRLHPPLPLLVPRCPSESTTIGGYKIPKGTKVFLNSWAMQRGPQLWEDPLQFKPQRFLDDPSFDFSGNNFNFLPFGTGRRICAGLPLAEKMLKYILATLWHSFEWELPEGTELEFSDKFGIVVRKMKPLVAIPRPRHSKLELYR